MPCEVRNLRWAQALFDNLMQCVNTGGVAAKWLCLVILLLVATDPLRWPRRVVVSSWLGLATDHCSLITDDCSLDLPGGAGYRRGDSTGRDI